MTITIKEEFRQDVKEEFKEILLENISETIEIMKNINKYHGYKKYPCIYENNGKELFKVVCDNDLDALPYLISDINRSKYECMDNYFIFDYRDYKITSYNEEELRFNLKTLIDDIMEDMIKFELSLCLDDSRIKELKYKKDKELKEKGKVINRHATLTRLERDKEPSYYNYAGGEIIHDFG
jgi:hypothetical protein